MMICKRYCLNSDYNDANVDFLQVLDSEGLTRSRLASGLGTHDVSIRKYVRLCVVI